MAKADTRVTMPIAEIAVDAYRIVFGRLSLLFDLAWLPFLIMLAATLVPGYSRLYLDWGGLPSWGGEGINVRAEDLIEAFTSLLCLNAFAVRWHQAILFAGEAPNPNATFLRAWGRFLLYTLLVYLISAAILAAMLIAAAGGVSNYVAPAAGILAALVWIGMLRCSLLFPAAAFGQVLGIAAAWRLMRGNTWRFLGCGILACAPVILVSTLLLSGMFTGFHIERFAPHPPLGFFILRNLIPTCSNMIVVALSASVLASFYRRIVLRRTTAL